jgi:hypothetical protein
MSLRSVSHTAINEWEGGDPAQGSAGSRQVKAWRGAPELGGWWGPAASFFP